MGMNANIYTSQSNTNALKTERLHLNTKHSNAHSIISLIQMNINGSGIDISPTFLVVSRTT